MLGFQHKNTNCCSYAKAVERKLRTASYNCKEERHFSLTWANKSIWFHVAWLSPFSWESLNTCSFNRIFLIEFNITWCEALVRLHYSKLWVPVLERPHKHKRCVWSLGSIDCDINKAYITRTLQTDWRYRDAVLDTNFQRLKQSLRNKTNLVLVIWQM